MSERGSPPVEPDAILGPDGREEASRPDPAQEASAGQDAQRVHDRVLGQAESGALQVSGPGLGPGGVRGDGGSDQQRGLSRTSRDTALIAQRDAKIRRRATDIVLSALRAPETAELPENALQAPPAGWTKKQLRIALDATNSMKAAPAYLGMAQRILESYRKAESEDKKPAPVLNATQVVIHQEFNYGPPIKVER